MLNVFLSRVVRFWFLFAPYQKMVNKYTKMKTEGFKYIDVVEDVYRKRFFKESEMVKDFEGFIEKAKSFNKFCLIKAGNWDYKVINFCFVREMLANIIWCLENGYKPIIDIYPSGGNYSDNSNLWEKMYKQPFNEKMVSDGDSFIECPIKVHCIVPSMQDARDYKKSSFWHKLYKEFVVYNDACDEYISKECEDIIGDKKVLACLIRGTDYTSLKPSGHPIQPSVEELIEKADEIMKKDNLEYIYLATEEKKIADIFKNRYKDKLLENKRKYFDDLYEKSGVKMVSQVCFDRENDDFIKILEYMSSINILSKCDSMVAGLCGGSEAAVYFNGGNYRTLYLFDKGVY